MSLKLKHRIKFPEKKYNKVRLLEEQVPIFAEHITEAGTVDYYASGEEPDDLIKALLFCCFSLQKILQEGEPSHAGGRLFLNRRLPRNYTLVPDYKNDSDVVEGLTRGY